MRARGVSVVVKAGGRFTRGLHELQRLAARVGLAAGLMAGDLGGGSHQILGRERVGGARLPIDGGRARMWGREYEEW